MSNFTKPLTLTYSPSDRKWWLDREFAFYVGDKENEEIIIVPEGFLTDLASVPIIVRWFIPKSGKYNQAAVLHDFLCEKKGVVDGKTYTSKEVHKIFLEAMKVLKVNYFKRHTMYRAVKLFGPRW